MGQSEGPRDMREILRRKLEEKMMMKDKEEERRKKIRREEDGVSSLERSESRRSRSPRERRGAITFPFPSRRFRNDEFLPDLKMGYDNSREERVFISLKEIEAAKKKIFLLGEENKKLKKEKEEVEKEFNNKEEVMKRAFEDQFKRHKEDIRKQGNLIQLCQQEINQLKKMKEESEQQSNEESISTTTFAENHIESGSIKGFEKESHGSQMQEWRNIKQEAEEYNKVSDSSHKTSATQSLADSSLVEK